MSLRSFLRSIDPTRAGSVVRRGLRELDPTRKASAMAGIGRAIDPTNKNSIVGKLAPYAVGLIPGIGLPLAAGLGAGFRTVQGIGRGAGIGEIARDAAGGAMAAGTVRGIARAVMPGTFAPTSAVPGIAPTPGTGLPSIPGGGPPDVSALDLSTMPSVPGAPAITALPAAPAMPMFPSPSTITMPGMEATSVGGPTISNLVGGGAREMVKQGAKRSTLSGIGSFLTRQPTTIPSILGTGAQIYGASQIGAAEDERLRMEREQFDEEKRRRAGRIGFSEWQRRRTAPGGAPTV